MTTLRFVLRPVLATLACASIAACADSAPRQTEMDYRSRPIPATQSATSPPGYSGEGLSIQSGEGEKLNVPWFVRDVQDSINNK
ncbi:MULTISPECIES: hypothetical protein [unclassified Achromobacter]|uniref:hypothetical protein n=1 Tax=unclassified Achromobacter TaxID=2626865 RepID=UPI000B51947E|nr:MULTISPECIES: hypothetical protein [unclassified Achromobacter]OWT75426.1 hypothetical protein CEY04_17710 [Achromobacter sp. HZ28]OWT76086.1 hypothetical protein CEY05_13160 [Achromobacter sp. HZ34]